jgi:predicted dehydrogenase
VAAENIVALCDVDDERAGDAYARYPAAKKFYDFRRMFDAMESRIDAVVVNTPDHTHFHPTWMALERGKHCFTEKPLAHSVWEVRTLTDLAAKKKVATQLGIQRHARDSVHRAVEIVRSGVLGDVRECHAWVLSERGEPAVPKDTLPVPSHLKWDLWLGPASKRSYHSAYAPYGWRFWWDFGAGESGNWGCHVLDIPFFALGLKHPTRVEVDSGPVHSLTTPKALHAQFDFPARGEQPALKLHWHCGKTPPEILIRHNLAVDTSVNTAAPPTGDSAGVLFLGSEGMLLAGFKRLDLYPREKFRDFVAPPRTVPRSLGFYDEWINACKGASTPPSCHFDYGGPLTETVLLGNAAYRAGAGFEWDAEHLRARGTDKIDRYLRDEYRAGWEVS